MTAKRSLLPLALCLAGCAQPVAVDAAAPRLEHVTLAATAITAGSNQGYGDPVAFNPATWSPSGPTSGFLTFPTSGGRLESLDLSARGPVVLLELRAYLQQASMDVPPAIGTAVLHLRDTWSATRMSLGDVLVADGDALVVVFVVRSSGIVVGNTTLTVQH